MHFGEFKLHVFRVSVAAEGFVGSSEAGILDRLTASLSIRSSRIRPILDDTRRANGDGIARLPHRELFRLGRGVGLTKMLACELRAPPVFAAKPACCQYDRYCEREGNQERDIEIEVFQILVAIDAKE